MYRNEFKEKVNRDADQRTSAPSAKKLGPASKRKRKSYASRWLPALKLNFLEPKGSCIEEMVFPSAIIDTVREHIDR